MNNEQLGSAATPLDVLRALEPAEVAVLLANVPTELLEREAQRRGLVAGHVGTAAASGSVTTESLTGELLPVLPEPAAPASVSEAVPAPEPLTPEQARDKAFQAAANRFLDPNERMSGQEQLDFMTEFWAYLDLPAPPLSDEQRANILAHLDASPSSRVVPTPLRPFPLGYRLAMAHTAHQLPGKVFGQNFEADDREISITGNKLYQTALEAPLEPVDASDERYVLGYKTPNGNVVNHSDYLGALLATNSAVLDNGSVWTFPVVELGKNLTFNPPGINRKLQTAAIALLAPETLMAMELLNLSRERPVINNVAALANEGLYPLRPNGNIAKTPVHAVTVKVIGGEKRRRIFVTAVSDDGSKKFTVGSVTNGLAALPSSSAS